MSPNKSEMYTHSIVYWETFYEFPWISFKLDNIGFQLYEFTRHYAEAFRLKKLHYWVHERKERNRPKMHAHFSTIILFAWSVHQFSSEYLISNCLDILYLTPSPMICLEVTRYAYFTLCYYTSPKLKRGELRVKPGNVRTRRRREFDFEQWWHLFNFRAYIVRLSNLW